MRNYSALAGETEWAAGKLKYNFSVHFLWRFEKGSALSSQYAARTLYSFFSRPREYAGAATDKKARGMRFASVTHDIKDFSATNINGNLPHPGIAECFSQIA